MKRFFVVIVAAAVLLGGCVSYSPSIPEGYTGPRAHLFDSAKSHGSSKADLFTATSIDGKDIQDSRAATATVNQGRGFYMEPVVLSREIPARSLMIGVQGRTQHAAPILALTGTVYQVVGTVTFVPEEGHTYVITGTLGEDYSAVWIEDAHTKEVVGSRVEVHGSAKLGFFQK